MALTMGFADLLSCLTCHADRVEVTIWQHFYAALNPRSGRVELEPSHEMDSTIAVYCARSCGYRVEDLHDPADVARAVLSTNAATGADRAPA